MIGTQLPGQLQVVVTKLDQHVPRRDEFLIVIFEALVSGDVADRAERRTADLARALGDIVGDREDLSCLLAQEQVVVAEMIPLICQWKFLVFR
jgi:hypothetical protein